MMQSVEDPTAFRANIQGRLNQVLDTNTNANTNTLATDLEKGVFNYAIKEAGIQKIIKKWDNPYFVQIYLDRLRSIYINLKNPELLMQLKTEAITPHALAFMTHQEMNPAHWKVLLDQKMKRDANKYTNDIQASTDMFTCRKCKSKRCTYYEMQTRSADEPATLFVTCLDCGKNWKS
jgi:transcription elongation factor S-II